MISNLFNLSLLPSRRLANLLVLFVVLLVLVLGSSSPSRATPQDLLDACHFGVTVSQSVAGYDVTTLGVSSVLNWRVAEPSNLPASIHHIKVLQVSDSGYATSLSSLPGWLAAYPGHVWIIGNEPDVPWQDHLYAEVYAERYLTLAEMIRSLDPSATIGFGPIAQPTPLRMRYMDRVIAELDQINDTQNRAGTLALIDVFTPHVFLVNENIIYIDEGTGEIFYDWGAGIPKGFEYDYADAFQFDAELQSYFTHDIGKFSEFVTDYRLWMKNLGAQNFPLWITEYTSVFPPIDPPDGRDFVNTSDEDTRDYLLATFDFILSEKDPALGYPGDDDRLVQRGFWYSLSGHRHSFGGTLFDPIDKQRTIVGDAYVTYNPVGLVDLIDPDASPVSAVLLPMQYTPGSNKTRVDYRLDVRVGNLVISDLRTLVNVVLRQNGGGVLASGQGYVARCGGDGIISLYWNNVIPEMFYNLVIEVSVDSSSGVDTNLANNSMSFPITPRLPAINYQPLIVR